MKTILVALACVLLAAALFASAGQAQDPGPDLGDVDLLALACDHAAISAAGSQLTVRNCRRYGVELIEGNRAQVSVRVVTKEAGPFVLAFHFQRSLWSVQGFTVEQK